MANNGTIPFLIQTLFYYNCRICARKIQLSKLQLANTQFTLSQYAVEIH